MRWIAVLALASCGLVPALGQVPIRVVNTDKLNPKVRTVPGWGEVIEFGALPAEMFARVQAIFTPYDYPTRSLREGHQGLVESWVMVGPDGRAAQVGIVRAPDRPIAEAVSGMLLRRWRIKLNVPPGKFVRVKLPPIQFRFKDCDGAVALEPQQGAVQVFAEKFCRPVTDTVVEQWEVYPAAAAPQ